MAKKNTARHISQEEQERIQQVLARYSTIAQKLHTATTREQAAKELTEINMLPENTQITLLKALAKETHSASSDILLALNELSSQKSVRKEARRALIQLEAAKVYPAWSVPSAPQTAATLNLEVNVSYRFWKGLVTDSLDAGEVQLVLCFEREDEPSTIRILGFLLDFFHDGVKDAFTHVESKRSFDKYAKYMAASLGDIPMKACSLAEGRQLILNALTVNERFHTRPHRDYRANLALIQRLVLNAPHNEEENDIENTGVVDKSTKSSTILKNLFSRKEHL